jgi:hypothetical protein
MSLQHRGNGVHRGHELGLDDREGVGGRAELRDQATGAVAEQDLGAGAANRAAMEERLVKGWRERDPFLHLERGLEQVGEPATTGSSALGSQTQTKAC